MFNIYDHEARKILKGKDIESFRLCHDGTLVRLETDATGVLKEVKLSDRYGLLRKVPSG